MKQFALLISLFAISLLSACKNQQASLKNEFRIYQNGFIYSEQAMQKLGHIADSLNLIYANCDQNRKFYSVKQEIGHVVRIDSGNLQQALRDIEKNISFEEFTKKYPEASIQKNRLILRNKVTNDANKEMLLVEAIDLSDGYTESMEIDNLNQDENNWYFEHRKKTTYANESITAFYTPQPLSSSEIPQRYALMIGYANCMIDTTTSKLKTDLKNHVVQVPANWPSLSANQKDSLLDELRGTWVVGICSQDKRPREHAMNIALLSAETYNWKVFLKAHLDIMNDRFERMSDGSYAQAKRNTYIRELEALHINVLDLILGISFRIENPASNHYFGNIKRIGRALAEAKNNAAVEEAILSVVSDNQLDHYNRLIFYFLFKNYNYFIEDKARQQQNLRKLALAIDKLPDSFKNELYQQKETD